MPLILSQSSDKLGWPQKVIVWSDSWDERSVTRQSFKCYFSQAEIEHLGACLAETINAYGYPIVQGFP